MGSYKRMPDQDMLDKIWETFIYIRGDSDETQAHMDYAIRCELGEPTLVSHPVRMDDGLVIGKTTSWQYNQRIETKRTLLGKLLFGWF